MRPHVLNSFGRLFLVWITCVLVYRARIRHSVETKACSMQLTEILPSLALELEQLLKNQGEAELAAQISQSGYPLDSGATTCSMAAEWKITLGTLRSSKPVLPRRRLVGSIFSTCAGPMGFGVRAAGVKSIGHCAGCSCSVRGAVIRPR
jgi:hypothetical protein